MLTDGKRMNGAFPVTLPGAKGVGWLSEVSLDFHLASPGPLATVTVGFNFKKKWQITRPEKLSVQCSTDGGTTFGNADTLEGNEIQVLPSSYYTELDGGRRTVAFMVADICGEDTDAFRVTVTPKAGEKDKRAVIDEIQAFAPFP